jgi:hypothetical protein
MKYLKRNKKWKLFAYNHVIWWNHIKGQKKVILYDAFLKKNNMEIIAWNIHDKYEKIFWWWQMDGYDNENRIKFVIFFFFLSQLFYGYKFFSFWMKMKATTTDKLDLYIFISSY